MSDRAELVEQLSTHIANLLDQVRTDERFTWHPTRDGAGIPAGKPLPARRRERWTTTEPGLLVQLRLAVPAGQLPGHPPDGTTHASAARSRPPGTTLPIETFEDLAAGIEQTVRRLRSLTGRSRGSRRPVAHMLRELPALLLDVDQKGAYTVTPREAQRAVRDARGWVTTARLAMHYDVPIVDLPWRYCPECGGKLRVRQDASSDVWCCGTGELVIGPANKDEPWPLKHHGCGAKWPRHSWLTLLDETTTEEAAASVG